MGGDFSWTLDPGIAATMLAEIVVGLETTAKENYDGCSKGITMGIRRVDFPLCAQERLAENRFVPENRNT